MNIEEERIKTNLLMLDYFEMWDDFHCKSINDIKTARYYNLISNLIDSQLDATIRWIDSEEAEEYFKGESAYQREVFQTLEDEWESILESKYDSVEALLSEVYRRGKSKGYADMRQRIKYTETDKLALAFARDYNFGLIQRLNDDTIHQIKNTIISGFLAGEHPNQIAPKILSVAEERLTGSTFTPRQRATMIAKTEISRVQNTGILQSYVNEGYTEVKILTAEDNNVCDTCLRYAFEFNNDDEIIYGNRGPEKVHNLIKLIKGGRFPPFHPLCRCTYLSVWESKGKPPENPFIINSTPLKFLDSDGEIVLPDGKPKIRWTEDSLREELSSFTDSERELTELTNAVWEYMNTLKNRNVESLSAMGHDYNMYCTQFSIDSHKGVDLCPDGLDEAGKRGLLFVIHNHPSNNPLQSEGDIWGFAEYNVKYNIVFTERCGLFILKNDGATSDDIKQGWEDIYEFMREDFKSKNSTEYWHIIDLVEHAGLDDDLYDSMMYKKVMEHMSKNKKLSIHVFKEKMSQHNVGVFHIKP
ncbi:phage minor head protein [Methanobrevibacter sp.]|uniref:phage minor head protein n=1 Tax=Methanobrevibacter sp. TaxID=66852 RepID=UPI00388DB2A6